MDEVTVTGKNVDGMQNFIVTKGTEVVRGSIILENGVVATFKPDYPLDDASVYVTKISEKIKDKQGNSLDYDMSWSFRTV